MDISKLIFICSMFANVRIILTHASTQTNNEVFENNKNNSYQNNNKSEIYIASNGNSDESLSNFNFVKASRSYIDLEPTELTMTFWESEHINIKLHPPQTLASLNLLIIYPCDILSANISQKDQIVILNNKKHNDKNLEGVLNESEENKLNTRCSKHFFHDHQVTPVSALELNFTVKPKGVGVGSLDVYYWQEKEGLKFNKKYNLIIIIQIVNSI